MFKKKTNYRDIVVYNNWNLQLDYCYVKIYEYKNGKLVNEKLKLKTAEKVEIRRSIRAAKFV